MESPASRENFRLQYLVNKTITLDTLHEDAKKYKSSCGDSYCVGSILDTAKDPVASLARRVEDAKDFIHQYYLSLNKTGSDEHVQRMELVVSSLQKHDTYEMTYNELIYGAQTAWRNAPRCIGRIQWNNLHVLDGRKARTAGEMFAVLCQHLEIATNKGNIRSVLTVFPCRHEDKEYRVWNSQLIQYAGYRSRSGTIIGDPASVEFTQVCEHLGWRGKGGMFDVLPIVLQADGQQPEYFNIPSHLIMEVKLRHPNYSWFEKMGLKWYCVPAVSNMKLDCGGLEYTACPFNGWYMGTEVGARDLCDVQRYNILPAIARRMGLDTNRSATLWKDKAMVEVNIAVLYSYQGDHVTIVDHHTASESFLQHMETETEIRGGCPADWVWIVPPLSGSACGVFHKEMLKYKLKPSFEYQANSYTTKWYNQGNGPRVKRNRLRFHVLVRCVLTLLSLKKSLKVTKSLTILYATETGRSLMFATSLKKKLHGTCKSKIICMNEYDINNLAHEKIVLIVTSTFGTGDPPGNGLKIWTELSRLSGNQILRNTRYSVFALGSSQYENFCKFGLDVDQKLQELGANRIVPVELADEMRGQEEPFDVWLNNVHSYLIQNLAEEDIVRRIENNTDFKPRHQRTFRSCLVKSKVMPNKEVLENFYGTTIHRANLTRRGHLGSKRTRTIRISISNRKPQVIAYEPGDRLKIFPLNRPKQVEMVMSKVNLPASLHNAPFVLQYLDTNNGTWVTDERFPGPISLNQSLTCFLDLNAPLDGKKFAEFQMATRMTKDKDINKIEELPTFSEVIEGMPDRSLDMLLLFAYIPILSPRMYSISSSTLNTIDLIYKKAVFQRTGGEKMEVGLCTSFLSRIPIGHGINCCVSRAMHFQLSLAGSSPVLMVGQGTGIAPFRSFWQHKSYYLKATKSKGEAVGKVAGTGPLHLYYGCKDEEHYLYRDEIRRMNTSGVINEVRVAFSQEKKVPKAYVQDLVLLNAHEIARQVTQERAYIFFCGNSMAWAGLCDVIEWTLMISTNMAREEAKKYVQKMKVIAYEPGDRLKIFPLNRPKQVEMVMSKVNLPASLHNAPFVLQYLD